MLKGPKIQAKIPSHFRDCDLGEGQLYALRDIQHSMSMVLDTRSYIWFIWQNITKCDRYYYKIRQLFYNKMRQFFYYKMLQFYYKMRRFYYKLRQLLQNVTFITNCDSTFTVVLSFQFHMNSNSFFKIWFEFFPF